MKTGSNSFQQCTSLSQVVLINGLTVMGNYMFSMFGLPTVLSSVTIPSTITSIGYSVFSTCSSISQVTFVNGLTVIGSLMFQMNPLYASFKVVTIPSTVTTIG